jgi:UrcA family protein
MYKSNPLIVRMFALLVLPALFIGESAFAAPAAEATLSVTVRYDDLNLKSPEGVASLYKRIENAATDVCRPAQGPESVSRIHWTAWNECFYHSIASAVKAVHNDKLSAYHWERIGGWKYGNSDATATVARR